MTFTQQVATQVLPAAATLASGLLLAFMAFAGKWLTDHAKSQRVKDILSRVCGAADASVRDVSNTLVDSLRTGGVLTPDARAKLKAEAEEKLRATLGSITVDKLRTTLGFATDAEMVTFLQTQIESAVWRMKLQQTAATAAPPVAPAVAVPPVAILALILGLSLFGASGCSFFQKHVDAITTDVESCITSNAAADKAALESAAGHFLAQTLMCDAEAGFNPYDLPACAAAAIPGIEASLGPDGKAFVTCALNKIEHDPNALAEQKARAHAARMGVERGR